MLNSAKPLNRMARDLIERTEQKGAPDNVSVVLVKTLAEEGDEDTEEFRLEESAQDDIATEMKTLKLNEFKTYRPRRGIKTWHLMLIAIVLAGLGLFLFNMIWPDRLW